MDVLSVEFLGFGGESIDCSVGAHIAEEALHEDLHGDVWVRSSPQVYRPYELCRWRRATERWDHFQLRTHPGEDGALVSASTLVEDGAGRLWVGTDSEDVIAVPDDAPTGPEEKVEAAGLFFFDARRQTFLPADADHTLPETLHCSADDASRIGCSISVLKTDRSGRLWIGFRNGRITRYDAVSGEVVHLAAEPGKPYSPPAQKVWDIAESPDGTIWLSADNLYRSRPNAGLFETADLNLNGYSIAVSGPDSLWVTGSIGIYKIPGTPVGPGSHLVNVWNVFDAHPLPSGDLLYSVWWIPEVRGFLYRLDAHTRKPVLVHAWSDSTVIADIVVDVDGSVWLGTRGRGLVHMQPDDWTFTRFRHDPNGEGSLAGDLVAAVQVDDSGTLWVGSD